MQNAMVAEKDQTQKPYDHMYIRKEKAMFVFKRMRWLRVAITVFALLSLLIVNPLAAWGEEVGSETAIETSDENNEVLATGSGQMSPSKVHYLTNLTSDRVLGVMDDGEVSLQITNSDPPIDGKQLWGIKYLINGYYKIVSLGYKDINATDPNGYVLTGSANGSVSITPDVGNPFSTTALSYQQQWKFHYDSTLHTYVIVNRYGTMYANTASFLEGSSSEVTLNNIATPPCTWYIDQLPLNGYFNGAYTSSTGNTKTIKLNIGSQSVYNNGLITEAIINECTTWENLSDKINIYGLNESVNAAVSDDVFHVYFYGSEGKFDNAMQMGVTFYYNSSGQQCSSLNSNAHHANIYLHVDVGANLHTYYANNTNVKRALLLHEMGHVLKLKHPKESGFEDDQTVLSIMNQGAYVASAGSMKARYPAFYDLVVLNNKWQNN